jgi:hypothetical protein
VTFDRTTALSAGCTLHTLTSPAVPVNGVLVPDAPMTGKRRARWIGLALLIAIVLSISTIWIARRAVGADTEQLAEQAVEMALAQRPARGGASDEQMREQMKPFMRGMLSLYPVFVPVGILFSTVVISTLLMGAYRIIGVTASWPMVFAGSCTGAAGSALARFAVTLVVVFIVRQTIPAESFLDNSIVPLNVAVFLPADTSAVWRSAAVRLRVRPHFVSRGRGGLRP